MPFDQNSAGTSHFRSRLGGWVLVLMNLAWCGWMLAPGAVNAARYSLLEPASAAGPLSATQGDPIAEESGLFASAARWRAVQLAPEVASAQSGVAIGDELLIAAFDGPVLTAVVDRIAVDVLETTTIRGRIQGSEYGYLLLSSRGGQSLADIEVPEMGLHYAIVHPPNVESHYVFDLIEPGTEALENGPPLTPPLGEGVSFDIDGEDEGPALGPSDPAIIDVLIVYTPAARAWALERGGIDYVIAQAMERGQLALDNSETLLSMRLVHATEVDYVEDGDSNIDLRRLTWSGGSAADPGGAMDEVHGLRDAYGADLVSLFGQLDDVGGLAWLLPTSQGQPQYGFSIIRVQQAGTHDTLIHEIGHNLGAHHHKQQNLAPGPNSSLNDYSAGWRWIGTNGGRYCSTMTYESGIYFADGLTHRRVPLFSNPGQTHTGAVAGHGDNGDNARTLRETKHQVAAYRTPSSPGHILSGHVRTQEGTGIAGVVMDGLPTAPVTDEDGFYLAHVSTDWTGQVSPRRNGFLFDPVNRLYFGITADQVNADYLGWHCGLADALDSPNLVYLTGGSGAWHCQRIIIRDGISAAGSGALSDNQDVWMETAVAGPGQLSFHWKVSSQLNSDFLELWIDGERRDSISGEIDWEPRTYQILAGTRIVRWRFVKDAAGSEGADAGWLDGIVWARHFDINTSASPMEAGSVLGGGLHVEGTEATLTAVAGPGYDFVEWREAGEAVSSESSYTFVAGADRELVAHFALKRYTLTYSAGEGGSIQGPIIQTISHGGGGTPVIAMPDLGYHFVQWSDGIQTATREDSGVIGNLGVEAQFAINEYAIVLSASPPEGGMVSGGGIFVHGTMAAISAAPNIGYDFVEWRVTGESQPLTLEPVHEFTATADQAFVAHFGLRSYTLSYAAGMGGSIQGGNLQTVVHGAGAAPVVAIAQEGYHFVQWSDGLQKAAREDLNVTNHFTVEAFFSINEYAISVAANPVEGGKVFGAGNYEHGSEASVSTIANPGYDFLGWSEDDQQISTDPDYVFTATAPCDLVAHFTLKRYNLTYTSGSDGSIQGESPQTVAYGGSGTPVSARPAEGYHFVRWSDGIQSSLRQDADVAADLVVEAQFAINEYTISLAASPPEAGKVFGAGVRAHGTEAILSAVANAGYDFVEWREAEQTVSVESDFVFSATTNRALVARFALRRYTLTYGSGPGGSIQGISSQNVAHGGSASRMVALPHEGYHFVKWSDGLQTAIRDDVNIVSDLAVEAQFATNKYAIGVSASPPEGGKVFGAGVYEHGTQAGLSAVANVGYEFVEWREGGLAVSTSADYAFSATAARELVALFQLKRHALLYKSGTGGSIQGERTQLVNHGGNGTTVVALPDEGHHFVQWTDGLLSPTRDDLSVTADLEVEARFALNQYDITASAFPPEAGKTFGAGTRAHGTEVSLSAVTNVGYEFVAWMDRDQSVSTNADYAFTATADRALVARFELERYSLTYKAGTGGRIQGQSPQSASHGGNGTAVVAVPNEGYHFVEWSDGLQTARREDLVVTADVTVEGKFALNEYAISVTVSPPEGGKIFGAGIRAHGTEASLSAVPNVGYDFLAWSENNQELSTDPDYAFTATTDRALIAGFTLKRYTLIYGAGMGGSIQGETSQTVTHGDSGTPVVAVPDAGARFGGWSDGMQSATRADVGGPVPLNVTARFRSTGGVSIDWYQLHGITPDSGQTWSDLDHRDEHGKGMILREEYIADTNPKDPNSVFKILAVEPGLPFRILFEPGSTNRLYTLQFSSEASSGSWTNVPDAGPRTGHGGVDSLTHTNTAGSLFYRVLVERP